MPADVWGEAARILGPAGFYVGAMAAYAVFVFKFYRLVADRDAVSVRLDGIMALVAYVVKFAFLFPAFALVWLATLAVMLALLAPGRPLPDVLLIALVVVAAVRVCAYYDQELARDLAKILPFAVLSTLLVSGSGLDVQASADALAQAGQLGFTVVVYWLFLVALELALRSLYAAVRGLFARPDRKAQ